MTDLAENASLCSLQVDGGVWYYCYSVLHFIDYTEGREPGAASARATFRASHRTGLRTQTQSQSIAASTNFPASGSPRRQSTQAVRTGSPHLV